MDLCCMEEDDPWTFDVRMDRFLHDRGIASVTGPRRTGREKLALDAVRVLRSESKAVSVFPGDAVDDPDVIVFLGWRDIDLDYIESHPESDVIYGQELSHQVPALVRAVRTPPLI